MLAAIGPLEYLSLMPSSLASPYESDDPSDAAEADRYLQLVGNNEYDFGFSDDGSP